MSIDMTPPFSVRDLVPHSEPMVLLDSVDGYDEHSLRASVEITAESLFAGSDGVPAWMGLEYMGQAIAALAGAGARKENQPIRIGFLVSTRRYAPRVSGFPLGTRLTVTVEAVTFNTTGLRVFECSIYNGDLCLVSANLNVYMPEDVDAFMKESTE